MHRVDISRKKSDFYSYSTHYSILPKIFGSKFGHKFYHINYSKFEIKLFSLNTPCQLTECPLQKLDDDNYLGKNWK